jgi:hypothetical protein
MQIMVKENERLIKENGYKMEEFMGLGFDEQRELIAYFHERETIQRRSLTFNDYEQASDHLLNNFIKQCEDKKNLKDFKKNLAEKYEDGEMVRMGVKAEGMELTDRFRVEWNRNRVMYFFKTKEDEKENTKEKNALDLNMPRKRLNAKDKDKQLNERLNTYHDAFNRITDEQRRGDDTEYIIEEEVFRNQRAKEQEPDKRSGDKLLRSDAKGYQKSSQYGDLDDFIPDVNVEDRVSSEPVGDNWLTGAGGSGGGLDEEFDLYLQKELEKIGKPVWEVKEQRGADEGKGEAQVRAKGRKKVTIEEIRKRKEKTSNRQYWNRGGSNSNTVADEAYMKMIAPESNGEDELLQWLNEEEVKVDEYKMLADEYKSYKELADSDWQLNKSGKKGNGGTSNILEFFAGGYRRNAATDNKGGIEINNQGGSRLDELREEFINPKRIRQGESSTLDDLKELLRIFGVPYVDAPSEAEAQCAYLEQLGLVDGTITEDSDTLLFGSRLIIRGLFSSSNGRMERYSAASIQREMALDREQLVMLALLLGSDYGDKIRGVGIVNAVEIVEAYRTLEALERFKMWAEKPDYWLDTHIYEHCRSTIC